MPTSAQKVITERPVACTECSRKASFQARIEYRTRVHHP